MQGYVYITFNNATDAHIISSIRLLMNVFKVTKNYYLVIGKH